MYKPVMKVIPNEFFTIPEHIKNPFFKGKQIVSEVHACAGYALILSDKGIVKFIRHFRHVYLT